MAKRQVLFFYYPGWNQRKATLIARYSDPGLTPKINSLDAELKAAKTEDEFWQIFNRRWDEFDKRTCNLQLSVG